MPAEGGSDLHGLDDVRPAVSKLFAQAGEPVTSGDDFWHLLTEPGTPAYDLRDSAEARRRLAQQVATPGHSAFVLLIYAGFGSRRRCRQFARDTGIELLREYVAIPSAHPPTCYVEDSREALRYFVTQMLAVPRGGWALSAPVEGAKKIARLFFPSGLVGAAAPARIALGRLGADPAAKTIERAQPRSSGPRAMLDLPDVRTLVVALSKDPNAKLTALLIPHGQRSPTMAVKMATTPVAEGSIAAERSVLSDLARLPGLAGAGIPRLIDYLELGGRRSLVTTAMPGSPMTTRYHAWRHVATESAVRADFAAAETWLARFQGASSGNRAALDMDSGRLALLRLRFPDDPMTEVLLDRLSSIYGHLGASSTPRTAVHGDFWFGNLLMTGPEITGVIDWEAGAASGEPILDLVRFALSYALYLDRHTRTGTQVAGHPGLRAGEWGAGIAYAVDGRGWFPDTVRDFVSGGLTRLGADPSIWRDALLAGLADVAATADHLDFATHHWKLFGRLTEATPAAAKPSRA